MSYTSGSNSHGNKEKQAVDKRKKLLDKAFAKMEDNFGSKSKKDKDSSKDSQEK